MLPGTNGIELVKEMLEVADVPFIFLSTYDQEEVIVKAFDMGADNYVVKPFSATELAARIRAASRRREEATPAEPYVQGDLKIDWRAQRGARRSSGTGDTNRVPVAA